MQNQCKLVFNPMASQRSSHGALASNTLLLNPGLAMGLSLLAVYEHDILCHVNDILDLKKDPSVPIEEVSGLIHPNL